MGLLQLGTLPVEWEHPEQLRKLVPHVPGGRWV